MAGCAPNLRAFVGSRLFNLTADSTNPNLVGALTRLQSPLSSTESGWENVILVEM